MVDDDHGAIDEDHGAVDEDHGAIDEDHGAVDEDHGAIDGRHPDHPAERAFLRWIETDGSSAEREDGSDTGTGARTWGQLLIAVTHHDDAPPTYDLRHVEDADVPVADLSTYEDPAAATDLVRFDDDGAYRPLKTAPTLPTGWVFPALDGPALVRSVEAIYPATIANWHREREGNLDVSHWRETADRQTGIYDLVDELSREQVTWLAAACCVDAECCKRREWDFAAADGDAHPLPVPRGDGQFPCREPCSLVIATAREVALSAREAVDDGDHGNGDYGDGGHGDGPASDGDPEGSLTQPEREQLARIVDAVADGEIGEIREGDLGDGANRRRVRYLRAKLAADGRLPVRGAPDTRADPDEDDDGNDEDDDGNDEDDDETGD